MSICSFAMSQCSVNSIPTSNTMTPSTAKLIVYMDEAKYTEALKNPAKSMQWSEESCRHASSYAHARRLGSDWVLVPIKY
jgi:hypothetical protein